MIFLYSLPMPVLFLLILTLCVLFGLSGVKLARRNDWLVTDDDNGLIGLAHGFAGMIYAVALGLLVVNVQTDYAEVEQVVTQEANSAVDLYVDSEGLSSGGDQIQQLVSEYVQAVIGEWGDISKPAIRDLESNTVADELAYSVISFVPEGDKQFAIYAEVLSGVNGLLEQRRVRLHLGVDGVGFVTWAVVIIGAIIAVGMTSFYRAKSEKAHYYMVGMMSVMFGLMVFLIVAMDHPLLGGFSVSSEPFRGAACDISAWDTRFHGTQGIEDPYCL